MGIKLFPSRKVVTRDDMSSPDPCRTPHDFSNPDNQAAAHESAGYERAGETDKSTDSTLKVFSDSNHNYRAQNGILWRKEKK